MQTVSEVLGKGLKVQSVSQQKIKKHCAKFGMSFKDFDDNEYAPND